MMMMEGGESARRPIKGVLLDLDGLLLDTEPLYFQAMQQVMDEYGAVYDDKLRSNVIGTGELYGTLFETSVGGNVRPNPVDRC